MDREERRWMERQGEGEEDGEREREREGEFVRTRRNFGLTMCYCNSDKITLSFSDSVGGVTTVMGGSPGDVNEEPVT